MLPSPWENLISGAKIKNGKKNCTPTPTSIWKSWGEILIMDFACRALELLATSKLYLIPPMINTLLSLYGTDLYLIWNGISMKMDSIFLEVCPICSVVPWYWMFLSAKEKPGENRKSKYSPILRFPTKCRLNPGPFIASATLILSFPTKFLEWFSWKFDWLIPRDIPK